MYLFVLEINALSVCFFFFFLVHTSSTVFYVCSNLAPNVLVYYTPVCMCTKIVCTLRVMCIIITAFVVIHYSLFPHQYFLCTKYDNATGFNYLRIQIIIYYYYYDYSNNNRTALFSRLSWSHKMPFYPCVTQ